MTDVNLTREHRLAVYGTLAPGESNEHVMAGIPGTWSTGVVRGTRLDDGWQGYPGITLDDAMDVDCKLFESEHLPEHWGMLDDFEGPGYDRVPVTVRVDGADVEAFIYALSGQ